MLYALREIYEWQLTSAFLQIIYVYIMRVRDVSYCVYDGLVCLAMCELFTGCACVGDMKCWPHAFGHLNVKGYDLYK